MAVRLAPLLLLISCTAPDLARTRHDAIVAEWGDARLAEPLWRTLGADLRPALMTLPSTDLEAMLHSERNEERMMARRLRTIYLAAIYGAPPKIAPIQPPALPPTWFPREEPDWLIVGSGPAGAVLAHELRRGGKRVLVVEQGSFVLPGAADTRALPRLVDVQSSTDGSILFRTGRAVGGGTTVNIDLAFPPRGKWGWDLTGAHEWVRATIGTRRVAESEINANNRLLWDGARAHGLTPSLYGLNANPSGDKLCAVRRLILPAMLDAENPLALLPDARVERVLFEGTRATGVEVRLLEPWDARGVWRDPHGLRLTGTITLRAKRVVLCAGALGSPLILLRSGVKNDAIGEGPVAHPSIPLIGEFDRTIDVLKGTPASVYVDVSERGFMLEAMAGGPEYAAMMTPGGSAEVRTVVENFRRLGGFGVMLIDTPDPVNRVLPDGTIRWQLGASDRTRFAAAVADAARILFKAGARRVILPTNELPPLTDIAQADRIERDLRFVPNRTIVTSAHLQATCKMGRVVGRDHRVLGFENLYVVDASVFPESAGANPMQTIYAMAKVFSDGQR